ncbi:ABC transporter permease [Clostridium felsineum]|uniref:ABC transporter permease n=1 Tax=Clostridium felsineum TaxID=36839 RepID=UPI0011158071|nr:ABC transporter permease [Clostridium felsineum]
MNIFLKYLLKSIFKKKGRSLLLIITITIAAALLITSLGVADSANRVTEKQVNKQNGVYNIAVTAKNTTYEPFFDESRIPKEDFIEFVPILNLDGYLNKRVEVAVEGVEEGNYEKLPNMKILKKTGANPLDGNGAIISERMAKAHSFKVGSEITIKSEDKSQVYKVNAIAESVGVFSTDEKDKFAIVVNEKSIWRILNINKLYNYMFASLKRNVNSSKFIKDFNNKGYNCTANLIFDKAKAESDMETVQILFYFMLVIVVFMSAFIIYSCFKLIVLERLPVIGTFLSQGETSFGIIKLLLSESIIYGLISGIISIFLGKGLLYLLADLQNNYKAYGVQTSVDLKNSWFIAGVAFAVIITCVSAVLPVLIIKKLQIKDIILNKANMTSSKYKIFIIGSVLVAISIIINSSNSELAIEFSPVSFILFMVGSIIILPSFIRIISYPLMYMSKNISIWIKLALNNIRSLKALLNNIRLIIISMVSILIILSFSHSYINALIGAASNYSYDIDVNQGNDPHKIEIVLSKDKNIKSIIKTYGVGNGEVKGSNIKLPIVGIEPNTYRAFNNYYTIKDKDKFYNDLSKKERNMAIDSKSAKSLKKSIGDSVVLKIDNREAKYKITGIFDAKVTESQILINKDNMINDFKVEVPDDYSLVVKGNVDKEKSNLENELMGTSAKVKTLKETVAAYREDFQLLITALMFFSIMTVAMGIFAIINNISVSFIQRKRELDVLSSVGATKGKNTLTIVIEGIFTAVFSIIGGGIISYYSVGVLGKLTKLVGISIAMTYDFKAFYYVCIGILVTMLLASTSAVIKNKKISIVEELKYE